MTKRKGIRLLAALALCFTLCISFTVPAFAYADHCTRIRLCG